MLTPVGDGWLDGAQLVCAVDETAHFWNLEPGGERLCHCIVGRDGKARMSL